MRIEQYIIKTQPQGTVFYTDRPDRHITAISSYYKKRVKTERIIAVTTHKKTPESQIILKVTIL
jgi:hypothetical protein